MGFINRNSRKINLSPFSKSGNVIFEACDKNKSNIKNISRRNYRKEI